MAMLVQTLSAKLGIVTEKESDGTYRDKLPKPPPAVWAYWVQAGIIAMAHGSRRIYRRGGGLQAAAGGRPCWKAPASLPCSPGASSCCNPAARSHWNSRWAACCCSWRQPTSSNWCSPALTCRACWRVPSSPVCPAATRFYLAAGVLGGDRDASRHLPALGPDPAPRIRAQCPSGCTVPGWMWPSP